MIEAVHLDEELVERLLALFVAERVAATIAANGVELVDEDDAGLLLAGVTEQPADARGADAGIHLYEIRTARRDERHAGFACHRSGKQRLAGAGRADQQDAPWDASANRGKASGVLEEVDDLLHLVLRFVYARDVGERHGDRLRINRPRLLERGYPARHHPIERQPGKTKEQETGRERAVASGVRRVGAADVKSNPTIRQVGHKRRVRRDVSRRSRCLKQRPVHAFEAHLVGGHGHTADASGLDVTKKFGKRHWSWLGRSLRPQREKRRNRQDDEKDSSACPEQAGAWQLASEHRYSL